MTSGLGVKPSEAVPSLSYLQSRLAPGLPNRHDRRSTLSQVSYFTTCSHHAVHPTRTTEQLCTWKVVDFAFGFVLNVCYLHVV